MIGDRLGRIWKGILMGNVWMVRAGEGGYLIDEFARGYVGIGWDKLDDLSTIGSRDDLYKLYVKTYPNGNPARVNGAVAMVYKFCSVVKVGDKVITYDPNKREYLVGTVTSDYLYNPDEIKDYPHIRKVEWEGRVNRDSLSVSSRNSLGSTLTLFSVNEDVWSDISGVLAGKSTPADDKRIED